MEVGNTARYWFGRVVVEFWPAFDIFGQVGLGGIFDRRKPMDG